MGKTIIVSSHILPELADICNKIGIIDRGVMIHNAAVADVLKQVRERTVLYVQVSADMEAAARLLEQQPLVDEVSSRGREDPGHAAAPCGRLQRTGDDIGAGWVSLAAVP